MGVGQFPFGVAITPDGTKVYVANFDSNNVSVIDAATKSVTAVVNVGQFPFGVAVTPDGTKIYVANFGSNNISVIDIATNKVTATVDVGSFHIAFGKFIGTLPQYSTSPTGSENHLSPLRFQTFNRKVF